MIERIDLGYVELQFFFIYLYGYVKQIIGYIRLKLGQEVVQDFFVNY